MRKGWHGDKVRHSIAATKSSKYRKKRKKGVRYVTKEVYQFKAVRDNNTGEFLGGTKPVLVRKKVKV